MDAELAEVALRLLTRRRLEAHHRASARHAIGAREVLEDADPALIAAGADLRQELLRGELGEVGEAVDEVVAVRVELARRLMALVARRSLAAQRRAHRVAAHAELSGDALDRLTRGAAADDVHPFLQSDQPTPPPLALRCLRRSLLVFVGGQYSTVTMGSVLHRQRHPDGRRTRAGGPRAGGPAGLGPGELGIEGIMPGALSRSSRPTDRRRLAGAPWRQADG